MEFEKERDRAFLEFKKEEAEKNRRHKLEIAKIFASLMKNSQQWRDFRYTPFDQTSFFQHSIQHAANFRVPHHNLHHHRCHLLNFIMQALPSGHLTAQKKKLKHRINPFQANVPFLYSLKTSENRRFSDVFKEYRQGALA